MPMESYWSKFESVQVWMTLTDSTVTQRQAHGTICAGAVVCNTHTSDFRATQEAIGTVWGSVLIDLLLVYLLLDLHAHSG